MVVSKIIKICKNAPQINIPDINEDAMYIENVHQYEPISQQTFEFHIAFGPALPTEMFL